MTTPLRIGVIGTGRIGVLHTEHLAHRIPNAEVVAVADIDIDAARGCADRFDVGEHWDDEEAIFDHDGIDAVVICSATDTHAEFIERAAKAGKHIFCEKPIDFDLVTIDRALRIVEQEGVHLQIGFNRRFDPNFRHVKQAVDTGEIGDPHILRITSRDPAPPPIGYIKVSGGLFFDMTIHDFDMARFLFGEVESVYAVGGVRVDDAIGEAGDIDTAVITLEFENGAWGTIDNSRKAVYGYDQRVEAFGSNGVVRAENETPHRTFRADARGVHEPLPLHFFMERYTESYVEELRSFVDSVLDDETPPVTGRDGRVPVVMAMAANRSLAERRRVALSEID